MEAATSTRLNLAELIAAFYAVTSGLWIGVFDVLHSATLTVRVIYGSEQMWSVVPIVAGLLLAVASLLGWHRAKLVALSGLIMFFVFTTVIFVFTEFRVAAFPAYLSSALLYALLFVAQVQRGWIRDGVLER